MGNWKLDIRNWKFRSKATVIGGAVVASALASVLIVSAQTGLKPPCNQFTDPSCHPAPPVVTNKASQTVSGDVNVTGKLCIGSGAGQFCLGGSGGGAGATTSGALVLLAQPLDITRFAPTSEAQVNIRDKITELTGTDPGPIKGVILRAAIGSAANVGSWAAYNGNLPPAYDGPSYFVTHGDGASLSQDANNAILQTSFYPIKNRTYYYSTWNFVDYGSYNISKASGMKVVATNANSQVKLLFIDGYYAGQPTRFLFIDGYYK